jgi:hypothetical protein
MVSQICSARDVSIVRQHCTLEVKSIILFRGRAIHEILVTILFWHIDLAITQSAISWQMFLTSSDG